MTNRYSYPVNGVSAGTQICGALAATVGGVILESRAIHAKLSLSENMSLLIYSLSLIVMFMISSMYHLKGTEFWRRCDHASIYLLIAGSYTPVFLIAVKGSSGAFWCLVVWLIALSGILLKIFRFSEFEKWSVWSYIALGWIGCFLGNTVWQAMDGYQIAGFLFGGVFFTSGAYVYKRHEWIWLPGLIHAHEIWHFFVLAGVSVHYWMIWSLAGT